MGNKYLYHLTFTISKFTLKNFILFEIVSDTIVSPNIFLIIKRVIESFLYLTFSP